MKRIITSKLKSVSTSTLIPDVCGVKVATEFIWFEGVCDKSIFIWLKVPISIISFSLELDFVEVNKVIDISPCF